MIDEKEFERRVNVWFALIMTALGENVQRLLNEGKALTPDQLDTPGFALAMRNAADYQAKYLPDTILACFLDPALPKDYFHHTSRLEFLLQQALLQRSAHLAATACIARARQRI